MLQSSFEDIADIFGVEELKRIAGLELFERDITELTLLLQELNLHVQQHAQVETQAARPILAMEVRDIKELTTSLTPSADILTRYQEERR